MTNGTANTTTRQQVVIREREPRRRPTPSARTQPTPVEAAPEPQEEAKMPFSAKLLIGIGAGFLTIWCVLLLVAWVLV